MADGRFVGDPDVLIPKGNEMKGMSAGFNEEIEKVYNTIEQMVATEYLSPEAKAIKEEIDKYKADLLDMGKTMGEYGQFADDAGQDIIKNQNGIIDEIK